MKRFTVFLLALLIMITPLSGCQLINKNGGDNPPVSQTLELDKESVSMGLFGETTLNATLSEGQVTWSNSNPNAVKMIEDGNSVKVIAISGGATAIITATSGDLSDSCVVVVSASSQKMSLSVDFENVEVRVSGKLNVPAIVKFGGETFSKATVSYVIENPEVATVDQNGLVTGVAAGETTLNVCAEFYGHKSNTISIPVIVKSGAVLMVNAANINLYAVKSSTNEYANSKAIEVAIYDAGVEHSVEYTAQVDNEDVISYENGVILAKTAGTGRVLITCQYGGEQYNATVAVKVLLVPPVEVKFVESTVTVYAPDEDNSYTAQLSTKVTVDGKVVEQADVSYEVTAGAEFISISESGLVTSRAEGSATVTAKYSFAGETYTANCSILIVPNTAIYYGQHEKFAHDGLVAKMTEGDTLSYSGVINTNNENDAIVRFQLIQQQDYNGSGTFYSPKGASNVFITLQDKNDTSNYVTVLLTTTTIDNPGSEEDYWVKGASIGARSGAWGSYEVGSKSADFYALNSPGWFGVNPDGYAGYNWGIGSFSFYNAYLKSSSYTNNMMAISVKGTSIYFNAGGMMKELLNLAEVSDKAAWGGFADNAELNVYVTTTGFGDTEFSNLLVDTIGGNAVTSQMAKDFKVIDLGNSLVPNE